VVCCVGEGCINWMVSNIERHRESQFMVVLVNLLKKDDELVVGYPLSRRRYGLFSMPCGLVLVGYLNLSSPSFHWR